MRKVTKSIRERIIEIEPLVACLPSLKETEITRKTYFSLTPKFYHKSGTELRLEAEQQMKLLTSTVNF